MSWSSRSLRLLAPGLALVLLTGCTSDDRPRADESGTEVLNGETISLAGRDALTWFAEGDYGAVLAHGAAYDAASWEVQASEMADAGVRVVALEEADDESITAAIDYLRSGGADGVALVGGSAGADSLLRYAAAHPDVPDRLIMLSANDVVEGLGTEPKLFIASEGEPGVDVSRQLADTAAGDDNEALIVPGSDHAQALFDGEAGDQVLQAVLDALELAEPQ